MSRNTGQWNSYTLPPGGLNWHYGPWREYRGILNDFYNKLFIPSWPCKCNDYVLYIVHYELMLSYKYWLHWLIIIICNVEVSWHNYNHSLKSLVSFCSGKSNFIHHRFRNRGKTPSLVLFHVHPLQGRGAHSQSDPSSWLMACNHIKHRIQDIWRESKGFGRQPVMRLPSA